jgi:hypothetical protein
MVNKSSTNKPTNSTGWCRPSVNATLYRSMSSAVKYSVLAAETGTKRTSTNPSGHRSTTRLSLSLNRPPSVAGLLMVVAARLVRRVRWWVRAVVPAVVWAAALVVQQAVNFPWLLPIFEQCRG